MTSQKLIKNEKIIKIIKWLFYLKMSWNQAIGDLTMPIQIFNNAIMLSIFLKVFDFDNYIIVSIAGVVAVISVVVLGHLKFSRGLVEIENSLGNRYNPELQRIVKNTDKHEQ